jgi:transcriptional regulator with XRE-family HTH domain
MARGDRETRSFAAIARRLAATRRALGLNQRQLCKLTGLATNQYNQWEKAVGRPSIDGAIVLCDALGLTLDWIYLGVASGLPLELAEKILTIQREPPPTSQTVNLPKRKLAVRRAR